MRAGLPSGPSIKVWTLTRPVKVSAGLGPLNQSVDFDEARQSESGPRAPTIPPWRGSYTTYHLPSSLLTGPSTCLRKELPRFRLTYRTPSVHRGARRTTTLYSTCKTAHSSGLMRRRCQIKSLQPLQQRCAHHEKQSSRR